MPILEINQAKVYYESHGSGEPVILIAGYTCDHLIWMPILDGLAKQFNVILLDNRGCGQTIDDRLPLSPKLLADDVLALSEKLELKNPHIVGQSMGGTIAQMVANANPEKMGKLCILTSSAKWRIAMLLALKSLLVMREKNIDFDYIFAATLPWLFGESFLSNDDNIISFKQNILNNPFPQQVEDQMRQFQILEKFDGIADLKKIKTPTFIAYGTQDVISLPHESELMANEIPHAKLMKFNCGHAITLEQPRELTQALIQFLKT